MTLTIEIEDVKQKSLEEIAAGKGKKVSEFVKEILDDYLRRNSSENPEINGKIDDYIKANPKRWEYIQALSTNGITKKMPSMTVYKKWNIVLVPFPFTDLSSAKRRPALIVSPDHYNVGKDVVIAYITSQMYLSPRLGDYELQNWKEAGLPKPSMVRMKFATIDKNIIVKKLGELKKEDSEEIEKILLSFFKS